jgi:hypothetical protein
VIFDLEQTPVDEPIEMEGGQGSTDLDGSRGPIAIDRLPLGDHVLIELPPNRLAEQHQRVQLPGRTVIHG